MARNADRMFYTTDQALHEALLESEAAIVCSKNDQTSSECSSDSSEESDSEPSAEGRCSMRLQILMKETRIMKRSLHWRT